MTAKVRTLYLSSFNMPRQCVSCGEDSDPELKWKVHWGQLEKDKITLSVDFPMCSTCGTDIKHKSKGMAKFVMGVFLILSWFACSFTSVAINSLTENKEYLGIFAGLAALVLVIYLGTVVRDLINTAGFTAEQKQEWRKKKKLRIQQQKKLNKCVKIANVKLPSLFSSKDAGYIDFEFENMLFAKEFSELNLGQLTYK